MCLGITYTWGIFFSGNDNIIKNNKLAGEADYGVVMASLPMETCDNTFQGNNLATLSTVTATYWCMAGTHDNAVIGYSGTVIDEGTDNTFTG